MNFFIEGLLLFCAFCLVLVGVIDQGNEIIDLSIQLPSLEKQLKEVQGDIASLKYEIANQENPVHLMEWLSKPECGHLKFPCDDEVIHITCD